MRTYPDCIPCFFQQALEACRTTGLAEEKIKSVLDEVARCIPTLELSSSPPAMARVIHRIIREQAGNPDPYRKQKDLSNAYALSLYPGLKQMIRNSEDRLLKAIEIAIAGNIIDYGAISNLDIRKELDAILTMEEDRINSSDPRFFAYPEFAGALAEAKKVLYLADNAGEIVFDKLLMEEMINARSGLEIICVVRGGAIINDCTLADAETANIHSLARVISNGADAPGTILDICSPEFLDLWKQCDLIISKGQGNFESLAHSTANEHIFFLFIAKCRVLADDLGCKLREVILCRNRVEFQPGVQ